MESIWDIGEESEVNLTSTTAAYNDAPWSNVTVTHGNLKPKVDLLENLYALNLSENLYKGLDCCSFFFPIKIQKYVLRYMFQKRRDTIVIHAQNKSGKTTSAILTILGRINKNKFLFTQIIMICPTCDSALEAFETIKKLTKFCPEITFRLAIRDKLKMSAKIKERIIVGTPEKINEFILGDNLSLHNVELLVIDGMEDMINDRGHQNSVLPICKKLQHSCQMILLCSSPRSSSMTEFVEKVDRFHPLILDFPTLHSNLYSLKQINVKCESYEEKLSLLEKVIGYAKEQIMVICKDKKDCSDIAKFLENKKQGIALLTGKFKPEKRKKIKELFKNQSTTVLVTTPAFADGICSTNLEVLVHCDIILTSDDRLDKYTYYKRKSLLRNNQRSYLINVFNSRWSEYVYDENDNKCSVLPLSELNLS